MGTAIVGVVIGLVLAYSLLSLIVSQINNLILFVLQGRSRFLVERMKAISPELADELMKHPLLNVIDETGKRTGVDAIKSEHFVTALLKILEETQDDGDGAQAAPVSQLLENVLGSKEFRNLRNMLRASKGLPASQEFLKSLDKGEDAVRAVKAYEELVAKKLSESKLAIQDWVDSRFTEMSKIYQQYMGVLTAIVGLSLAVFLNVDSLFIAQTLWNEPTLRASVVDAANQVAESELRPTTIQDDYEVQVAALQTSVETLLNTSLPIGWVWNGIESNTENYNPANDMRNYANFLNLNEGGNWGSFVFYKIIGWALTAFALSLGTDFWFNILRNLTGRGSSSSK